MNSLAASGFSVPANTPNWSVQALTNGGSPACSTGVGAAPQSTPASSSDGDGGNVVGDGHGLLTRREDLGVPEELEVRFARGDLLSGHRRQHVVHVDGGRVVDQAVDRLAVLAEVRVRIRPPEGRVGRPAEDVLREILVGLGELFGASPRTRRSTSARWPMDRAGRPRRTDPCCRRASRLPCRTRGSRSCPRTRTRRGRSDSVRRRRSDSTRSRRRAAAPCPPSSSASRTPIRCREDCPRRARCPSS